MFEFLKLRPGKSHAQSASPSVPTQSNRLPSAPALRRDMMRVVLKEILHRHGIPAHWLACDFSTVARSTGVDELHLELSILKWNEQLLRYAPALQAALLHGLNRFDPSTDHAHCKVSWRFADNCGYPYDHLPDPQVWREAAATSTPTASAPVPILDRRRTPRTPRIPQTQASAPRPASAPAIPQSRSVVGADEDYPATQIAPMR